MEKNIKSLELSMDRIKKNFVKLMENGMALCTQNIVIQKFPIYSLIPKAQQLLKKMFDQLSNKAISKVDGRNIRSREIHLRISFLLVYGKM